MKFDDADASQWGGIDFATLYDAADAELTRFQLRPHHRIACAGMNADSRTLTSINLVSDLGPASTCAEPALLAEVVRQGIGPLIGLLVLRATYDPDRPREIVPPCGRCRELLLQYSPHVMVLIWVTASARYAAIPVERLLPDPFHRRPVSP